MPGRIIRGASEWKHNLDWSREDVLVLQHGVELKLTYHLVTRMQRSDFVRQWKVKDVHWTA
jgi:hypothetical protein